MAEMRVGIRDLKSQLSAYLREVKNGQTIVITDHGQVVARLVPVAKSLDERLKAMVAAGLADWNGETLPPVKYQPRVRGSRTVSDLVIEDRE
ncbi:MAG: type II toxin-antitoxin system prevent-host-death family antitoxin [Anaerolineales bacterium]